MPDFDEYTEEIKELWESHWLTNHGVKARQLKDQLKEYLHTDNLELTVNGHMALELITTQEKNGLVMKIAVKQKLNGQVRVIVKNMAMLYGIQEIM